MGRLLDCDLCHQALYAQQPMKVISCPGDQACRLTCDPQPSCGPLAAAHIGCAVFHDRHPTVEWGQR
jgi:hypothetical protein